MIGTFKHSLGNIASFIRPLAVSTYTITKIHEHTLFITHLNVMRTTVRTGSIHTTNRFTVLSHLNYKCSLYFVSRYIAESETN